MFHQTFKNIAAFIGLLALQKRFAVVAPNCSGAMAVSERKSPVRRGRWLLRTLVALVVIGALGRLVVWRFIGRRGEAALEAEREEALYKNRATSLTQLQTAEATFRADQAGVATAEAQVRTLKVTVLQEWGVIGVGRWWPG